MQGSSGIRFAHGLILLSAACVLIFGLTQLAAVPEAAQIPSEKRLSAQSSADNGRMPQGYETAARPFRDPFVRPAELLPQVSTNTNAQTVNKEAGGKALHSTLAKLPELSGIVSGSGVYAAILRTDGESRTYRTGQQVGGYTIVSIQDTSVELAGAGGNAILRLGR